MSASDSCDGAGADGAFEDGPDNGAGDGSTPNATPVIASRTEVSRRIRSGLRVPSNH